VYEFVLPVKPELPQLKGLSILALILFVFSCRTLPEMSHSNIADSLPPESNIIMKIAISENEALLEALILRFGFEPEIFSNISKHIEHLAIGLEIDLQTRRKQGILLPFHIAAIGNWPRAFLGGALGDEWVKSGRNRWLNSAGLEIIAISNKELLISSGKLDSMLFRTRIAAKNTRIRTVGLSSDNSDLAFWLLDTDIIHKILPVVPLMNHDGTAIVDLVGIVLNKMDNSSYSIEMIVPLADPKFAEPLALAIRIGFASQIGRKLDFINYEFLSGLSIEARESGVILKHNSIPTYVLENFLNYDFGLGNDRS